MKPYLNSTKCCFFHLVQSPWDKIQELGLANHYHNNDDCQYHKNDDCKVWCGMLNVLAFLPFVKVQEGMQVFFFL